jgi:hypothetical protein
LADWILIQTKFSNNCTICGKSIDVGDTAYWKKRVGLKHYPECTLVKDESKLVILDDDFEDYLK